MSIIEKVLERRTAAERLSGERLSGERLSTARLSTARRVVIDRNGLRAVGLLPPAHQEQQIAEQYRQIKRPLVVNAMACGAKSVANSHVIMLASALSGEGKTFTAVNLAFSIAREKDVSVLLVDADTPKPEISRRFDVASSPGLLDVLQSDVLDVESVILPTDVPRLSLLPAGTRSENATELLASENMRRLLTRLGERDKRRIILIDSPPLLLTTESQALAAWAGQIVLVVRAAHTTQQTVLDALAYLEDRPVALVLNQSMSEPRGYYYYYGYGETGEEKRGPSS
jgi:protein-tyrosine kinase